MSVPGSLNHTLHAAEVLYGIDHFELRSSGLQLADARARMELMRLSVVSCACAALEGKVGEKVGDSSSDTVGDCGERCGEAASRRWAVAPVGLREVGSRADTESLRLRSSARWARSSVSFLFSTCEAQKDA